MADEMNGERETPLGFRLEKRGDVWVVQYDAGGCQPASIAEVALWKAFQAGRASLAANAGSEPVAEVVQCYTPSGKRVALRSEAQGLPIGTQLYTPPSPPEGMAGWMPIETAPKDVPLLLWGKYWNHRDLFARPLIGAWSAHEDRWMILGGMRFGARPTHWMPLPAPPIPASEAKGG